MAQSNADVIVKAIEQTLTKSHAQNAETVAAANELAFSGRRGNKADQKAVTELLTRVK